MHNPQRHPWEIVQAARDPARMTTLDYVKAIFDDFLELHGDRCFSDDPALVGGIASLDGRALTFIGTQKGRTMKEGIARNFGMAHPEGYRKAVRLAKQAEIFGRPIITFIDTAGAFPDIESETRGIGESIARSLKEFSLLRVPVLAFILGEGGSGGALALAVANEVYMLENAIYSVISPEGCASILFRDASKAKEAAKALKLTAEDLLGFGVIEGIIAEKSDDGAFAVSGLKAKIREALERLSQKNAKQLVRERIERFHAIGSSTGTETRKQGMLKRLQSLFDYLP